LVPKCINEGEEKEWKIWLFSSTNIEKEGGGGIGRRNEKKKGGVGSGYHKKRGKRACYRESRGNAVKERKREDHLWITHLPEERIKKEGSELDLGMRKGGKKKRETMDFMVITTSRVLVWSGGQREKKDAHGGACKGKGRT